jgi:1-acyl-sn-glycerol-3-phosphate acyltransferase
MSRPLWKRLGYDFLHLSLRQSALLFTRVRCEGRMNMPMEGRVLVCSNHQSSLDPPLIGMALDRRLNFLAKQSLFKIPLFKYLIRYLDAIPIDREGASLSGIKETLRRLKQDEAVLIFPEGTRSRDGKLNPLKTGFVAVARRSKAPLVPVAIDGAYQCWPPSRSFPWPHPVAIVVGKPIVAEEFEQMTDEELLAELETRIQACFATAKQRIYGNSPDKMHS